MINFKSAGVRASLSTADLDGSLSKSVTPNMGKEQALDDKRVHALLAAGNLLPSTPIGTNGGNRGVLQYLGQHEDIPFMMTEAGEKTPLTPSKPQALRLTVETNNPTHHCGGRASAADLKIEVLVNGTLSGVCYINSKRWGATHKYTINGTRIQRQIEKPWTYQPSSTIEASHRSAVERWETVAQALKQEASARGTDQFGLPSPCGNLYAELAALQLPERLRDMAHLGIIDVVVASGKGGKDGPANGYIARPTRLKSSKYKIGMQVDHVAQHAPVSHDCSSVTNDSYIGTPHKPLYRKQDSVTSPSSPLPSPLSTRQVPSNASSAVDHLGDPFLDHVPAARAPLNESFRDFPMNTSSSDVPLAVLQQSKLKLKSRVKPRSRNRNLQSDSSKSFAESHGIMYDPGALIEGLTDRKGRPLADQTMNQALSSVSKMTPRRQIEAIRQLQELLPQSPSVPAAKSSPARLVENQRFDEDAHAYMATSITSSPDPFALRSQPRGSPAEGLRAMVVNNGADPGGRLVGRIASLASPLVTLASVAQSPSFVQPEARLTPWAQHLQNVKQGKDTEDGDFTIVEDSARRKVRKLDKADDQSPEAAQASFEVPELFKGCAVGFAEANARRQIQKVRPGFFDEDDVIVCMRFVVV